MRPTQSRIDGWVVRAWSMTRTNRSKRKQRIAQELHRSRRRRHKSRNPKIGSLHASLVAQQSTAARNPKRIAKCHSMPANTRKPTPTATTTPRRIANPRISAHPFDAISSHVTSFHNERAGIARQRAGRAFLALVRPCPGDRRYEAPRTICDAPLASAWPIVATASTRCVVKRIPSTPSCRA
jgi:hypothetical protein